MLDKGTSVASQTVSLTGFKNPEPVGPSHTRTDSSFDPEIMREPSLEMAIDLTAPVWPFRVINSAPENASHTLIDLLSEPETMVAPSLDMATGQSVP